MMREALAPYQRSRLLRAVVGPTTRPPIGVLHYFGVRVDDAVDESVADARRRPVFELLPRRSRIDLVPSVHRRRSGNRREAVDHADLYVAADRPAPVGRRLHG